MSWRQALNPRRSLRARTDGKGFVRGQGLRGVLAGLSGGFILNHTVEI